MSSLAFAATWENTRLLWVNDHKGIRKGPFGEFNKIMKETPEPEEVSVNPESNLEPLAEVSAHIWHGAVNTFNTMSQSVDSLVTTGQNLLHRLGFPVVEINEPNPKQDMGPSFKDMTIIKEYPDGTRFVKTKDQGYYFLDPPISDARGRLQYPIRGPYADPEGKNLDIQRDRIVTAAKVHIKDEHALKQFLQDVSVLEQLGNKDKLDSSETTRKFSTLAQMLEGVGNSEKQNLLRTLAPILLKQAVQPDKIHTGVPFEQNGLNILQLNKDWQEIIIKTKDGHYLSIDGKVPFNPIAEISNDQYHLIVQRDRLKEIAGKHIKDEKVLEQFLKHMQSFEQSTAKDKLYPEEIACVYSEIRKMLDKTPASIISRDRDLPAIFAEQALLLRASYLSGQLSVFEAKDVSPDFAKKTEQAFDQLPAKVRAQLKLAGYRVLALSHLTHQDGVPKLAGVRPRGWNEGTTWENSDGIHDHQTRRVLVAEQRKDFYDNNKWTVSQRATAVLWHEVAHAIDHVWGKDGVWFSNSDEFKVAYERDVANLSQKDRKALAYQLQKGDGGRCETFADVFPLLNGGPSYENKELFNRAFPNVAKLIASKLHEIQLPEEFGLK